MSVLTVPVNERDHIRGSAAAPVILLEYGDFECPACGMAYPIVKALEARLGAMLAVAFRHFPLSTVHPHAERAAEAAEAAGAQGKFWPMHDTLFENQQALEDTDLVDYALQLGLDVSRFASDLGTHRHAPKVRADFTSGVRSGVNGTPTFFVNGVRHDGPYDAVSLLLSIQAAAAERKHQPARAARAPRANR
jgi:protein-disulfide isomerase